MKQPSGRASEVSVGGGVGVGVAVSGFTSAHLETELRRTSDTQLRPSQDTSLNEVQVLLVSNRDRVRTVLARVLELQKVELFEMIHRIYAT
jgi:hypothetical protein